MIQNDDDLFDLDTENGYASTRDIEGHNYIITGLGSSFGNYIVTAYNETEGILITTFDDIGNDDFNFNIH